MTYAQLQTRLQAYLIDSDIASMSGDLINMAMRKLERKYNFRYMKARTTKSLIAGDYTFDNPILRYKKLITSHVIDSDGLRYPPLLRRDYAYVISCYPDLTEDTGTPTLIAEVPASEASLTPDIAPNHQLIIRPTADEAYTLDIQAYQFSPALDGTTYTTNWLTENVYEILLYGALIEAELYNFHDGRLPTWKAEYSEAVSDLAASEKDEEFSGSHLNIAPDAHAMGIVNGDFGIDD